MRGVIPMYTIIDGVEPSDQTAARSNGFCRQIVNFDSENAGPDNKGPFKEI